MKSGTIITPSADAQPEKGITSHSHADPFPIAHAPSFVLPIAALCDAHHRPGGNGTEVVLETAGTCP